LLAEQLREPAVDQDAKLRLWCLALKGYAELDFDSASANHDWSEALVIATRLHETQWAARAEGELGIIAFLQGNTASAVSLVGKAILSAYRTGDVASQVRLLSMLGNGFVEERRFAEALTMFRRAIRIAEQTPDAGFPYLAYRGEAAALVGLHRSEEDGKHSRKRYPKLVFRTRRGMRLNSWCCSGKRQSPPRTLERQRPTSKRRRESRSK